MNTPDDRNRELASALADLEAAAERVASLAKGIRADLDGPPPRGPRPQPGPMPPHQPMQGQPNPYGRQPMHDPVPNQVADHMRMAAPMHLQPPPPPPNPRGPIQPPAPPAPPTPAEPWWSNEKTVLKVTAVIGAIITISGVGLLVALAIQSGLLGPLGRVILAYGLAAALAVTAAVVHRKNPENAGVAAAGGASVITAHITTTVLVHMLEWWPHWLGTIVVLAVMGLGYLAARMWRSVALHGTVLAVSFITASLTAIPRLEDTADVTAAVLIPSVAAAWAWLGMPKRPAISIIAVIVFLFGSIRVLADASPGWFGIAAFIVLGVALAVPEFLGDSRAEAAPADPGTLAPYSAPARATADLLPLQLLAWLAAPMTSTFGQLHLTSISVALVLGLAIGAAGFGPWRDFDDARMSTLRWAGLCSAALPALQMASFEPELSWTRMPSLLLAAAFIWFHVFRPTRMGRWLIPLWTVVALMANLPALVLTMFAPSYLAEHRIWLWTLEVPNVIVSGLLIGVIALGLIAIVAARREKADGFDKGAGLAGLLLTAVPVITALTAAGVRFSLAHVLVSIGWMVAAAWLMLAPKRLNVGANMAASLVIAGAAVIKLVFYDMQAMSGLTRVSAFLLCGLLMLGMVVARSLRDRDAAHEPESGAGQSGAEARTGAAAEPAPHAPNSAGPEPHERWGTGPGGPIA